MAAARKAGCSWAQIASRLGVSRQVASRRFAPWVERFTAVAPLRPGNLPSALTTLVGRHGETIEAARLLASNRLVTLTGAAGVGKSRLALSVATGAGGAYTDGAWWVDLAPLSEESFVAQAVASALGVAELPGRSLRDSLVSRLRAARCLLVLDNCEHVVEACAALVEVLVRNCPPLSVLATSRQPLGMAGEAVWRVPPLELPASSALESAASPAVTLFCHRAAAAQPGFSVDSESAPVVAEICRRLDGLPLAIELAAARVGVLSPAQIAARLDDRFSLLAGQLRATESHHRSLADALAWSHDLLSEPERALFRRLAVFAGSFSMEAVEAVCTGGEVAAVQVVELLAALVSRSLVVADATGAQARYRLLETLRVYGHDRLEEASEVNDVAERHARWFADLAESAEPELTGPEQAAWLERLSTEHDNFRTALSWAEARRRDRLALVMAGALIVFWRVRGHFSEGRRWLQGALAIGARSDASPSPLRAKALWGLGFLTLMAGDSSGAMAPLQAALDLYRALGDASGAGRCLLILGNAEDGTENRATQVALLDESVEWARQAGDHWCLAHALALAGVARARSDQAEHGRSLLEEAVVVARLAGDAQGLRIALLLAGEWALAKGDWVRAEALVSEGLQVVRVLGEAYGTGVALGHLIELALGRGEWPRAGALLDEMEQVARRSAIPSLVVSWHCLSGRLALAQGDATGATRSFALALSVDGAHASEKIVAMEGLGEAAAVSGDRAGARLHLEAVADQPSMEGASALVARAQYHLGRLAEQEWDHQRAASFHRRALRLRLELGDLPGVADSLEAVGLLASSQRGSLGTFTTSQLRHAAQSLGAAEHLRQVGGYARWPPDNEAYEAGVPRIRARLGESRSQAAWQAGASMPIDYAVARALDGQGKSNGPAGSRSLTDKERQVAALAAEGLTNPQIGERLMISRYTARAHLSAAFAKLGIGCRRDLPAALARLLPPDEQ